MVMTLGSDDEIDIITMPYTNYSEMIILGFLMYFGVFIECIKCINVCNLRIFNEGRNTNIIFASYTQL